MTCRTSRRFSLLAALLLLAGCSALTGEAPAYRCPETGLLPQADRIVMIAPGSEEETHGGHPPILAEGQIANFTGGCRPDGDGRMQFALNVRFEAQRLAADEALAEMELPYFIAIIDNRENIITREAFSTRIALDDTEKLPHVEEHVLRLPASENGTQAVAESYKIVIGFILSPAQLAANRAPAQMNEAKR